MKMRLPRLSLPFRALFAMLFGGVLLRLFGSTFGLIVIALGLIGRVCQPAEDGVHLS